LVQIVLYIFIPLFQGKSDKLFIDKIDILIKKKDLLFFFQNILIITWNQKTKSLSKLSQKKQIVIIKQKLKFYEKN